MRSSLYRKFGNKQTGLIDCKRLFSGVLGVIFLLSLGMLGGCKKEKHDTLRIATKPMTEQFILAEMLSLLIEEYTDYKTEITKGVGGGTSNIHPAMEKGDFDMYPEYTGTGWLVVLKKDSLLPASQMFTELQKEYHDKFNMKWVGLYGFNNTYGLAVKPELAQKYQLKSISDLAEYPDAFSFGAEYDFFEIHKGYDALCNEYDLKFKKTMDMDIGLKYEAIKAGKVDVLNIFTTDGQLAGAGLTILQDDKNYFPSYHCATVVREEVLNSYPGLEGVLMKMQNSLSDAEMAKLNYEVDINGRSERSVAAEFLKSKGLLPTEKEYGE